MDEPVNIDEILKALANPVRRDILAWLKEPIVHFEPQCHAPLEDGVCVSRICQKAELSQSTVSCYLAILQRAGLVTSFRDGAWTFYRRNEPVIEAFHAHLKREL